jgi:hypothetical protein
MAEQSMDEDNTRDSEINVIQHIAYKSIEWKDAHSNSFTFIFGHIDLSEPKTLDLYSLAARHCEREARGVV